MGKSKDMQLDGFDAKGRPAISDMSDREMLCEILLKLRDLEDAIYKLGEHPMIKAALPADMRAGAKPDVMAMMRAAQGQG